MIFFSIFLDDDYFIDRITRPVSTVLDIGANIGFFSIAARKSFPQATIHSYEPNIKLVSTSNRIQNKQIFTYTARWLDISQGQSHWNLSGKQIKLDPTWT